MSLTRSIDELVRLAVVADTERDEGLVRLREALESLAARAREQRADVCALRADAAREALARFTQAIPGGPPAASFTGVLERIGDLQASEESTMPAADDSLPSPFIRRDSSRRLAS